VIAVTCALILYIFLVNYVARVYHRPGFISKSKPKFKKSEQKAAKAENKEKAEEQNTNEELGLEKA
jgi:hypothetical protein